MKKAIIILFMALSTYSAPVFSSAKITHIDHFPNFKTIGINLNGKIININNLVTLLDSIIIENKAKITTKSIEKDKKITRINYEFSYFVKYDTLLLSTIRDLFNKWKINIIEYENPNIKNEPNLNIKLVFNVKVHQFN
jgi:hypothetical protein